MDSEVLAYITEVNGWLFITTPYDKGVIEAFKELPRHTRRWDASARCWTILAYYKKHVIGILKENGYRVYVQERERPMIAAAPTSTPFVQLFSIIPRHLHLSLYRHLCLVLHPDKGGSEELMKALNISYDQVKNRIQGKEDI